MKLLTKIFGMMILFLAIPTYVFAIDDTVPTGAYYFSGSGVLTTSDGVKKPDLFNDILTGKQKSTVKEMEKLASKNFTSGTITGDLHTGTGVTLWDYNLQDLRTQTTGKLVTMSQGSKTYKIFIPRGKKNGVAVNTAIINNAIAGIEKYQEAVKEGILAGSLTSSYNVYSMYPSKNKQVPVTDILEEKEVNGRKTKVIKTSGTRVTMNYSLDMFYNPIFGSMDANIIKTGKETQKFLEDKVKSIKVKAVTDGVIEFDVSSEYIAFIESYEDGTLTEVSSSGVVKSTGITSYKTTITKTEYKPKSLVDKSMQLIVPSIFSKNDGGSYKINSDKGGFTPVGDIRLLITDNFVYGTSGDETDFKQLGDYSNFGIDPKSLVLYSIKLNKEGKYDPKGKQVGAVIPLWFKEGVVAPSEATGAEGTIYATGRTIKFGNNYSGDIKLEGKNKDMFAVDSQTSGKQGIELRNFAFAEKAHYKTASDHQALTTIPDNFTIQTNFENGVNGAKGFVIYRNNWYIKDPDLIKWLESSEAKAITDVKAEILHKLITGDFETEAKELSYEEWLRLSEIRSELDTSISSKIMTGIRAITLIFGFFIIFYSIMLVIAYWFDLFNVFTEISILNLMTNKRLYPISTEEDISYLINHQEGVQYVSFIKIVIIMLCGISVGLLFIFSSPIIEFILFLYYKISSWIGVI